jgi:uncharacterized membrane protein YedE/YeeE
MLSVTITPYSSLFGGFVLGGCVLFFRVIFGKILGISGIVGRLIEANTKDKSWRFCFTLGLIGAGAFVVEKPNVFAVGTQTLVLAGVLVGFGTQLGSGCTSGHGLCGLSRLSPRSWVATPIFMLTAMITRTLLMKETYTFLEPVLVNNVPPYIEYVFGALTALLITGWYTSPKVQSDKLKHYTTDVYSLLVGILFGVGLSISGMTDPTKVYNFLSFPTLFIPRPESSWAIFDPSLMLVMMAGMMPNMILNPFIEKMEKPRLAKTDSIPTRTDITFKLVFGASVFGVGWAIAGVCPGPALVSLFRVFHGEYEIVYWMVGFFAGSKIANSQYFN